LFLWLKLRSVSSSSSSESIQDALGALESWQKKADLELSTQYDRVRSALGRFDREKRKSKDPESTGETTPDEQGELNRVMAQKFFGPNK
jgi:hypothetical protein